VIRAHTTALVAVLAEKFGYDRPAVLDPDGGIRADLDAQWLSKATTHAAFIHINLSSHSYTPGIRYVRFDRYDRPDEIRFADISYISWDKFRSFGSLA
jgi:hypothetical protein